MPSEAQPPAQLHSARLGIMRGHEPSGHWVHTVVSQQQFRLWQVRCGFKSTYCLLQKDRI